MPDPQQSSQIDLSAGLSPKPSASIDLSAGLSPKDPSSGGNLKPYVSQTAKKYGLNEDQFQAQAGLESNYNQSAVSPKGAKGVFQFMPETAKAYGITDPNDPKQNIDAGGRYMSDLQKKYGGDTRKALAAYNWGPTKLNQAISQYGDDWDSHIPTETANYINRISPKQSKAVQQAGIISPPQVGPKQDFLSNPWAAQDPHPTPTLTNDQINSGIQSFSAAVGAPPQASDFLTGPAYAVQHPVDSAKLLFGGITDSMHDTVQEGFDRIKAAHGFAETAAGALETAEGFVPIFGPMAVQASKQYQSGDWAGGTGTTLGMAATLVTGKYAERAGAPEFADQRTGKFEPTTAQHPSTSGEAPVPKTQPETTSVRPVQPAPLELPKAEVPENVETSKPVVPVKQVDVTPSPAVRESVPVPVVDPLRHMVESTGAHYRGTNDLGQVELALPRSMTEDLNIRDAFKDNVSVTLPKEGLTPEGIRAAMDRKVQEFAPKPAIDLSAGLPEQPAISPEKLAAESDEATKYEQQAAVIRQAADLHERNLPAAKELADIRTERNVVSYADTGETNEDGKPIKSRVQEEAEFSATAHGLMDELQDREPTFNLNHLIPNDKPPQVSDEVWNSLQGKLKTKYVRDRASIIKDWRILQESGGSFNESDIPDRLKDLEDTRKQIGRFPQATKLGRQQQLPLVIKDGKLQDPGPLWTMNRDEARRLAGVQLKSMPSMDELRSRADSLDAKAKLIRDAHARLTKPIQSDTPIQQEIKTKVVNSIAQAKAKPEANVTPTQIYDRAAAEAKPSKNVSVEQRIANNAKILKDISNPNQIKSTEDIPKVLKNVEEALEHITDKRVTEPLKVPMQQQLARDMGITEDDLLHSPIGKAYNAEQIRAFSMLLEASQEKVMRAQAAANADPATMDNFTNALARHQALDENYRGIASKEAGRALQAINPKSDIDVIAEELQKLPEESKKAMVEQFAKLDPNNKPAINQFARKLTGKKLTAPSAINEFYISSLVSSAAAVKKVTADVVLQLASSSVRIGGGLVDMLHSAITGRPREQYVGEVTSSVRGQLEGLKNGWEVGAEAFMKEGQRSHDINDEFATQSKGIPGKFGKGVRLPIRLLSGITEMMHVVSHSEDIHASAYRQAVKEGLNPASMRGQARIKDLVTSPTEARDTAAHSFAKTQTLQESMKGGGTFNAAMRWLVQGRNTIPGGKGVLPFITTPANYAREGVRYSPIGLFNSLKDYRNAEISQPIRNMNVAKGILGTAMFTYFLHQGLKGNITYDGPKDYKKQLDLKATGWQPKSIKTPDGKYVPYAGFGPLSINIGMAAAIAEAFRENPNDKSIVNKAGIALQKFSELGNDIPGITMAAELTGWISGHLSPGKAAANMLVPGVVRSTAHLIDPTIRNPGNVAQDFEANLPYASKRVPPVVNPLTGEDMQRPKSALGGFNPFPVTSTVDDKVTQEQGRIAAKDSLPSRRSVAVGGKESPSEKATLDAQDAKQLHGILESMGDTYLKLNDNTKQMVQDHIKQKVAATRAGRLMQLRRK